MLLIPTFSPQGDGNPHFLPVGRVDVHHVDPYLFPARGRKPRKFDGVPLFEVGEPLIPTFSPQGDGNLRAFRASRIYSKNLVDPYLFPARGRKRHDGIIIVQDDINVDPYLFPARGRKLRQPASQERIQLPALIPTFSPQGDGNPSFSL